MSPSDIRSDTAGQLTEFWQELLDVDDFDPGATLLDLGGNSLIATMVANRIDFAWGFRPSLEELLTVTFAELVERCEHSRTDR